MIRRSVSVLLVAVLARVASIDGQSASQTDILATCAEYGQSELLFVGSAGDPVTFHVSGAALIESARQNLLRTEAHVEHLRATLDATMRDERELEIARTLAAAEDELRMRQAMYPPPYDLTLIPMRVEQALRGTLDSIVMVHEIDPSTEIRAGEQYLIRGNHSTDQLPYFPETADMRHVTEYIDIHKAASLPLARRELDFLAGLSGASIAGSFRMQSFGDGLPTPLSGIRIVVSSGSQVWETTTSDEGDFVLTGLRAGRLKIQPVLPRDLTVTSRAATMVDAREGGCERVHLTANLNGRVRGRVFTASPREQVKITLFGVDPDAIRQLSPGQAWLRSHAPHVETSPNEDGTFELSGAPPGWYVLRATVAVSGDRQQRYVTTYYPGTPEMGLATPIEVGRATEHDGFDFVIATE